MKRLKFVQSIAGNGSPDGKQYPQFVFPEGYVGEILDDSLADAWVESGIAEYAKVEDVIRPPKPEFAVAIPVETAMARRVSAKPKVEVAKPELQSIETK